MPLSIVETYTLASKVRTKLTRQASDPRAKLANLVVQANMLDNLMDSIASYGDEKRLAGAKYVPLSHVSFDLPKPSSLRNETSISEYEVDLDSDDDSDFEDEDEEDDDETTFLTSSSYISQVIDKSVDDEDEDDDDYYYSSDEDESPVGNSLNELSNILHSVSSSVDLTTIEELDESIDSASDSDVTSPSEDIMEMPELCTSNTLTDDENDYQQHSLTVRNYVYTSNDGSKISPPTMLLTHSSASHNTPAPSHHRSSAVYSMEQLF